MPESPKIVICPVSRGKWKYGKVVIFGLSGMKSGLSPIIGYPGSEVFYSDGAFIFSFARL